jgi:hypothetical protein
MKPFCQFVAILIFGGISLNASAQNSKHLKVGVLLPFFTDTSSTMGQKQISQAALDYYAGLRLAAEALNEWNISVDLRVWDLQKMDDSELEKLPKSAEFRALDIFIGPLTQKPVDLIASNLSNTQFLWVSPLATLKLPKAVQNINFFGHDSVRIKGLVNQLKQEFPQHSFCLVVDKKDVSQLAYYKKALKNQKIAFTEHQLTGSKLNPKLPNKNEELLLINVGTSSFTRLAQFQYVSKKADSYIIGDLSWYDQLTASELIDETKIIYPSMNYISGTDSEALDFTHKFIQIERAEPSKFAFQAYDQLFFLGAHYANNGGIDLSKLPNASYSGLINTYKFKNTGNTIFVNQGVRLIRQEKIELQPLETQETQK